MSAGDVMPPWDGSQVCAQVDPEVFFPPKGGDNRPAKALCLSCPLRQPCLEYALAIEDETSGSWGIWGGLSPIQRRRLRQRDAGARSAAA